MAQEQKSDDRHDEEQERTKKQQQQQRQREEEEDEERGESPPPSKVARVSSDKSLDADAVTTAVASPLMLGLGLSVGANEREEVGPSSSTSSAAAAKAGFTFMQMQEFHHQALIFKHMVAGIPVPIHLILPIWKSVAASYGPHHYPSFVGLGNLCYDFRNSMEPEPGRCRRTDGKKWRCSRDVVPEQKYCERHMHRGRNRSRKPVEPTSASAAAAAAAANSLLHINNERRSTNLSITIPDDDDVPTNNNNNTSSSTANLITARMTGSSPTSVLSTTPACKTGAS